MLPSRVIASVVLVRVVSAADVVIVGAGQAGMAAAHLLASEGHTVHVLEATDHVGGRTRNIDAHTFKFDVVNDDALELGGTWFSPSHTAALKLCHELGIEVYNASFFDRFSHESHGTKAPVEDWPWWFWGSDYPLEQQGHLNSTVFHTSKGVFRFRETQGLLTALPQDALDELNQAGRFLTKAVSQLSSRCWAAPFVDNTWRRWDVDTTFGTLRSKISNKESTQVLRNSIHDKNAEEPEEVSFLYNLLSFKGCFSAGPDSQFRVRGGTQAIPHAIATRLSKNVTLNAPVRSIRAGDGNVQVTTRGGVKYSAAAVIVTGPPPTVLNIDFEPPLAGTTAQLLQRMPMGTSMKFSIIYQQGPWWRAMGFQGDIISTSLPLEESLPDSGIPLFVQCVDHSPYSLKAGVLVCLIEGRQNLYFTSLPAEKQRSLMLHFLTRSFNDTRASTLNPKCVAHNWADQPFARGAYTGFMPPGVLSVPEFWESYRNMEKLPNVFLAGSDYHAGFGVGFIEGAIRSGQLAAQRVQTRLNAHRVRNVINKQSASPALYV